MTTPLTTQSLTLRLVFRCETNNGLTLKNNGPDQSLTLNSPYVTATQRQKIAKIVSRHLGLTKAKGWSVEFGRVSGQPSTPMFTNGREYVFAPRNT